MKEYTFEEYEKIVLQGLTDTPNIHFIYEIIKETSSHSYKKKHTGQYLVKRRQGEDTLQGNERRSWVLFHDYLQQSINELIRQNYEKELKRLNIHNPWPRARTEGCAAVNIDVYIGININIRNITVCEFLADFLDYCDRHNVQHPVFDIDKISEPPEGWSVDEVLEKYRQSGLPYQKPYVARYALKELEVSTPYKGLSSFTVADSKFFFGRDEDIGNIRRKIEKRPFVAVLGSSGSGKSSVVHGGVIPSLPKPPQSSEPEAKSGWSCITFKPSLSSQNPFLALAEVLYRDIPSERFQDGDDKKAVIEDKLKNASEATASKWLVDYLEAIQKHRNSSYLLLVIDQFEELFTPDYQDDRNAFIELLRVTADKQSDTLRIVITMRDDYLTRAQAECGAFYNLISDDESHHLIKVINSKDRFRDIITEPAKQNGVEFQEEAVDAILDDLLQGGSQANILPLLEYALTEIWKHREGRRITVQAVEKVGDVLDFLPDKAEAFYQSDKHSDDDRKTILRIFLNLANFLEVNTDNLYSKSTQRWDSQPDSPEAKREWELIQTLAGDKDGYRFLNITYDDSDQDKKHPYVEIVHDILLTTWKTLRTELDRNIPFFIWNKETKNNAKAWLENGKDQKYLLSGRSLAKAEDYLNSARILDADTIKFIETSTAYHQQKERTIKRIRTASISTLVVLLFFSAIAAIGLNEKTEEAELKNKRLLAEVSANFLKDNEIRLAILTALEALEDNTQAESRDEISYQKALSILIGSVGEYVEIQRHFIPGLNASHSYIVTSDLEKLIFASWGYEVGGKANIWSLSKGRKLFEIEGVLTGKYRLSHSGQIITSRSHALLTGKVWDLENKRLILDFTGRDIREVYLTEDKQYYMSRDGSGYSSVGFIDPITHIVSEIFSVSDDERLALSPDGCCFYHAAQGMVTIYTIDNLNYKLEKVVQDSDDTSFIFSLDQRFILAFKEDGSLRYGSVSEYVKGSGLKTIKIPDHVKIKKIKIPETRVAVEFDYFNVLLSEDGEFLAFYNSQESNPEVKNFLHIFHIPSGIYLNSFPHGYVDYTETTLDTSLLSGKIVTDGINHERIISNNVFDIFSKRSWVFDADSDRRSSLERVASISGTSYISGINEKYSYLSIFDQIGFSNLLQIIAIDSKLYTASFADKDRIKLYSKFRNEDDIITSSLYWNDNLKEFQNYTLVSEPHPSSGDDLSFREILNMSVPVNGSRWDEHSLCFDTNNRGRRLFCGKIESYNKEYSFNLLEPNTNKILNDDVYREDGKVISVFLFDKKKDKRRYLFDVERKGLGSIAGFSSNGKVAFSLHKGLFSVWDTKSDSLYGSWRIDDKHIDIRAAARVLWVDEKQAYVIFTNHKESGKKTVLFYDIFTGEIYQSFLVSEDAQIFHKDGVKNIIFIEKKRNITVRDLSTGNEVFKLNGASSDVLNVDINPDGKSIIWLQSTGEVFMANIDKWSEENLIDAFRELTIQPLSQSERENFNLN